MKANSVRSAISAHKRAGGLMLFGLALAPACSFGASVSGGSGLELEEIVVTALKREERLLDVPVPVTAVTADTLLEQNQTTTEQFFNTVPGINLQSQYGRSQLAIRGITTGPASGNPVVGFTIDDVPFGSSTGNGGLFGAAPDVDPSELSRIEVLRGPQGTLYGAASIGGLMKYVLVYPSTDKMSGSVGTGVETINGASSLGYNVRGAINIPLSDTFALRASTYTRTDPGYIDNIYSGKSDANNAQVYGGRLASVWRPTDELSVKLNIMYQDRDVFGSGYSDVTLGKNKNNDFTGTGRTNTKHQLYSAIVDADLGGDAKLTSVTAYAHSSNLDLADFSKSPLVFAFSSPFITFDPPPPPDVNWGNVLTQKYSVNKFTQEVRVAMPFGEKIDWLAGAFYTREAAKYLIQATAVDRNTGVIYLQPDDGRAHRDPIFWDDNLAFTEYAAFTNLTVRFTDQFDVQVGARYSINKQDMHHREWTFFDGPPLGTSPTYSLATDPSYDGHSFTYQVSPRFKISSDHMIYGRFATGYRAGGPNPASTPGLTPSEYGPDTTKNYEIGAKGNLFGEAASYDISVYRIDWNKLQITANDPVNGAFTFLLNGSQARSEGIEAAFELTPREGLTLSLWGTYIDAKVKEGFGSNNVFVEKGDRMPYSSRLSGRFSATQEFNLSGNMTAHVGGSITYVGDRLGEFVGSGFGDGPEIRSLRAQFPAYTLVDLNTGVKFGDWKVNMFAQNVFDKRGINSGGFYNQSNWNRNSFVFTQPRTIGLNLDWSF